MAKVKQVALYSRVSTADQCPENQLIELRRYVAERGWSVQGEYTDAGVSGTKASRPALDRLMEVVRKRRVDAVLVWRFDRFARSVKHLVLALDEMRSLGIGFISYQENIDTVSALGQAIFTIIAAMAALERDIIIERVNAGMKRARSQGKHIGRPRVLVDMEQVLRLRRGGRSLREIATKLKLPKTTIARALSQNGCSNPPL